MAKKAAKKTASKQAPRKARPKAGGGAGQKTRAGADTHSVRQLVRLMVQNDLTEIRIVDGSVEVHLKRGAEAVAPANPAQLAAPRVSAEATPEEPAAEEFLEIKSPMVGTFYAAPSPESEAYVAVGSSVTEETVVCIIEAMKVMNEIKAECDGTLVEVCVQNAQPVEYGQTLFRVRPR